MYTCKNYGKAAYNPHLTCACIARDRDPNRGFVEWMKGREVQVHSLQRGCPAVGRAAPAPKPRWLCDRYIILYQRVGLVITGVKFS